MIFYKNSAIPYVELKAAVAPSLEVQNSVFSSLRAVAYTAEALSPRLSWIPEMETLLAPACQRMDFPGLYWPIRYMAWVAVIQVLEE